MADMKNVLTKIPLNILYVCIANTQIVGMSATIGNLPELAKFLDADVYQKDFRPVELQEFIKCGSDLVEIKKNEVGIENTFAHHRTVSFNVKIHKQTSASIYYYKMNDFKFFSISF